MKKTSAVCVSKCWIATVADAAYAMRLVFISVPLRYTTENLLFQ